MIKKKFFLVYVCLTIVLFISSCSSTTIPKEVLSTAISSTEDSITTTSTEVSIVESTETVTSTATTTSVPTTTSTPPTTIIPKTNFKAIDSLPNSGMMCLTFDDGFSNVETILNCLRQNNIHCTFFIIGRCLKTYPDLWKQAVADGNEICYHSMTHGQITSLTDEQILTDVTAWNELAHKILGNDYVIPKIARLPGGGGNTNQRVLSVFNSIGYSVISWNADTLTGVYRNNKNSLPVINQQVADYVLAHAAIGTIELQHFNQFDAPSVTLYIETIKQKYNLGKISDALIASSSN